MPTASNLSETVKSKFLQLSGGTVTGALAINRADGHIYKKDASGRMMLRGGTSTATDGASIYLTGKDYSSGASTFQVRCHDGTNDKSFIAKPDGTLTWGGKPVVVVNSWQSGVNWYRKYSDGWIEQGGQWTIPTTDTHQTVSFNTSFKDTNYTIQISMHSTTTKVNAAQPDWVTAKTTTGCTLHLDSYPGEMNYYACGY